MLSLHTRHPHNPLSMDRRPHTPRYAWRLCMQGACSKAQQTNVKVTNHETTALNTQYQPLCTHSSHWLRATDTTNIYMHAPVAPAAVKEKPSSWLWGEGEHLRVLTGTCALHAHTSTEGAMCAGSGRNTSTPCVATNPSGVQTMHATYCTVSTTDAHPQGWRDK